MFRLATKRAQFFYKVFSEWISVPFHISKYKKSRLVFDFIF